MVNQTSFKDECSTPGDQEPKETSEPSASFDVGEVESSSKSEVPLFQNIPLTDQRNYDGSLGKSMSQNEDLLKIEIPNPFNEGSSQSNRNDSALIASLKTSAVELFIEFYGMTRIELFGRTHCFVVIFSEGTAPGSWEVLDQGNLMPCEYHMRCFKRFRLRAATEIDRNETYLLALYASGNVPVNGKLFNADDAWAFVEFTVSQVLESDQMILETRLKYGKSGVLAKGTVSLALDVIYHVKQERKVALEFGFLAGSPRRNRMYFEVCKALRRGKWIPLYKSETRSHEESKVFETVHFDEQDLYGGDIYKLIRLEVFRWYKNGRVKLLGFIQTNFDKLSHLKPNDQLYWWPAEDGISSAKVIVQDVKSTNEQLFLALRMANMF